MNTDSSELPATANSSLACGIRRKAYDHIMYREDTPPNRINEDEVDNSTEEGRR